jgi:HK97 family phage portal protein
LGLFDRWTARSAVPVEFVNDDTLILGSTYSGENVSPKTSVQLVPVWAAVQLVAGAVGSLPLKVYRTDSDGSRVETPSHRAAKLLAFPNQYMAGDEMVEQIVLSLLLWGNAFVLKIKSSNGVVELWPLDPSRVKVTRSSEGYPLYVVDGKKGPYTQSTILHIRGLSFDGLVGLSPIQMARQGLGTYAAAAKYQGRFWKNNATPGGVLTHPSRLSPDAAERLRAQWNAAHRGDQANSTAILEEGMSYQPLSLPLSDSKLLEAMDASVVDVARLFQVPSAMLQTSVAGQSMQYSSTEMEYQHFLRFTLRRWLSRIEKSLMRDADIFLNSGLGAKFTASFDATDLTRGDTKTIADINIALFKEGIVTRDEVRAELGRAPIDVLVDAPVGEVVNPVGDAPSA